MDQDFFLDTRHLKELKGSICSPTPCHNSTPQVVVKTSSELRGLRLVLEGIISWIGIGIFSALWTGLPVNVVVLIRPWKTDYYQEKIVLELFVVLLLGMVLVPLSDPLRTGLYWQLRAARPYQYPGRYGQRDF